MPWSSLANNQTISFTNLANAVATRVFTQKQGIPDSNEQITKADANAYVNINTSYAPYAAKASNQLVVKSDLQAAISAPYVYTLRYTVINPKGNVINGWDTSNGACAATTYNTLTVYSPDATPTSSSKFYSSPTGGGFNIYSYSLVNQYYYLDGPGADNWVTIIVEFNNYTLEATSIGVCSYFVYISPCVPNYMNCYSYYTFVASADVAVDTAVQVEINWSGDLGGFVTGTVTIFAGTTCNSTSVYTGGNINCLGENVSTVSSILNPSAYGNQIYSLDLVVYGYCPC